MGGNCGRSKTLRLLHHPLGEQYSWFRHASCEGTSHKQVLQGRGEARPASGGASALGHAGLFDCGDPDVRSDVRWTTLRSGTGHGFMVWVDRTFSEKVCLSNSPLAPESTRPANLYQSVFFPWSTPVSLAVGDTVSVTIGADLIGDSYTWHWSTRVRENSEPIRVKANFSQSTFFGVPLAPTQLHKRAADYVPALTQEGQVKCLVLHLMKAGTPLGKIAHQIAERFPDRYPDWQHAMDQVGKLSQSTAGRHLLDATSLLLRQARD